MRTNVSLINSNVFFLGHSRILHFRLVELAKLRNRTRAQEKRQFELDPMIRKTKNKAGIIESRVVSCGECGDDFCNGNILLLLIS